MQALETAHIGQHEVGIKRSFNSSKRSKLVVRQHLTVMGRSTTGQVAYGDDGSVFIFKMR